MRFSDFLFGRDFGSLVVKCPVVIKIVETDGEDVYVGLLLEFLNNLLDRSHSCEERSSFGAGKAELFCVTI